MKPVVDYSLYLVTDSTPAVLGDRDLCHVVCEAIQGGVTLVQYRDKTSDTAVLIETAKKLHTVCKEGNVPLLINDRVDVALAVDCEGVHLGQDDMDAATARMLLGPNKIIGVTACSMEEAYRAACWAGADYLGIGTVFATPTKENTKSIIGISGLRDILVYLGASKNIACRQVPTVCIGGINAGTLQRVVYQSRGGSPKKLDGVAVVSAIIAAKDPKAAASDLKRLFTTDPPFAYNPSFNPDEWETDTQKTILDLVPKIIKKVSEMKPLSHNMTNTVVQNFAANVALSIGASPIMSPNGLEAADLAALAGGLVINMGTAMPGALSNWLAAVTAYNTAGGPVCLDPVGCGATAARRDTVKELLAGGYFDLIKGNESEILTVARARGVVVSGEEQQRGVDSSACATAVQEKAAIVAKLARRERNVILMTGATDYLSDGTLTFAINGGCAYMGMVTGTGCTLGATLAAFMAAWREDRLMAVLAGILLFKIAGQRAGDREDVKGPGTFVPAFLDELYLARKEVVEMYEGVGQFGGKGYPEWLERARVEVVKC
ncbi:TMP-TENI-domain-containing protein [Lepidopterella palustris CBS 459.81]|uniref:TMP-TENI-domain-containing protein n=1 Tax=Lepidopterella palustris CBS 459.81 TaxID=1314670 RepID=A0A8E2JC48_9PEZI|nr:TMP-TENI-domain-containing protein [Lepidopterella palustris CBS 459.81]